MGGVVVTARTAALQHGRRGGRWAEGAEATADRLRDFREYRTALVKKSPAAWPEGRAGEDGWGMARHRELAHEVARLQAGGHPVPPAWWASVDLVKAHDTAARAAAKRRRTAA